MSITNFTMKIRRSFWYLPCLYGVISCLFAFATIKVDAIIGRNTEILNELPPFLLADIDLAQTILSSISSSLLTMTTITFSTILVVLTTYLSQFSPRTLQNFITDHSTQRVLGIFVGGFIYSILLLLFLREDDYHSLFIVPTFAVIVAIICLIVFVFFIHHVTSWIQVSNLIHDITVKTIESIEKEFTDEVNAKSDAPWDDWESGEISYMTPRYLNLPKSGYIQYIDVDRLVKQANEDDCIVRIEKRPGDYIDQDTPLLAIWNMGNQEINNHDYERFISIGPEKSPVGDIQFGLTKLVEIALRALSPGINDPNTAINSINQLGKILSKISKKHLPRPYHNDENRNLRVILELPTFSDYLYKSFYQIRQYGANDISVLVAIIKALTLIAEGNLKEIRQNVWEFAQYIIEGVDHDALLSLDRKYINQHLKSLAKATGKQSEYEKHLIMTT